MQSIWGLWAIQVYRTMCLSVISCFAFAVALMNTSIYALFVSFTVLRAIETLLVEKKTLTPDLGGTAYTSDIGHAVLDVLAR